MAKEKIFCIGLSRTGTTSLHVALLALGVSSIHYPGRRSLKWLMSDYSPDTTKNFTAFSDIPTSCFFKQLHETHPNAKFIYTRRSQEKWLESIERHIAQSPSPNSKTVLRDYIRLSTYGAMTFQQQKFLDVFCHHEESVSRYFESRREQFLKIDLENGEMNWETICSFLDIKNPGKNVFFPRMRTPSLGSWQAVSDERINIESKEVIKQLTRS